MRSFASVSLNSHLVMKSDEQEEDKEQELQASKRSFMQTLTDAVVAVDRLAAARESRQWGKYGAVAWNAQFAARLNQTVSLSMRVNWARLCYSVSPPGTSDTLVALGQEIAEAVAMAFKEALNAEEKAVYALMRPGLDRIAHIVTMIGQRGAYDDGKPSQFQRNLVLPKLQLGISIKLSRWMLGADLGDAMAKQMVDMRLQGTYVPFPEEMIVLQSSSDTEVSAIIKSCTHGLRPEYILEEHFRESSLRQAARISSIFHTESGVTAQLLDSSVRFARLLFDITRDDDIRLRAMLIKSATTGQEDSWVVRGACSSEAEAITGGFALRGQRPASVAFWRMVGWRISDEAIAELLTKLHDVLDQGTDDEEHRRTMQRLVGLCLHCQTRLSLKLLMSPQLTTAFKNACAAYAQGDWPKDWCSPLNVFCRRLGGTLTLSWTASLSSAGLLEQAWALARSEELRIMEGAHLEKPKTEEELEREEEQVLQHQEVSLNDPLASDFFRWLSATLLEWVDGIQSKEKSTELPSRAEWLLTAMGLLFYDEHDPAFVHACLCASVRMHRHYLLLPTPSVETANSTITHASVYSDMPPYVILPSLPHGQPLTADGLYHYLRSEEAQELGARMNHRVAQQIAFLLKRASTTKVASVLKRESVSLLHPSRHVAIVMVSTPLEVNPNSRPIVFGRLLTSTTAMSFMPSTGSDADRFLTELARQEDVFPSEMLMRSALLRKEQEQVLISRQIPVASGIATRFIQEWQLASRVRHNDARERLQRTQQSFRSFFAQDKEDRSAAELLATHTGMPLDHAKHLLADEERQVNLLFAKERHAFEEKKKSESSADTEEGAEPLPASFDEVLNKMTPLLKKAFLEDGKTELHQQTPAALPSHGRSRVLQIQRMEQHLRTAPRRIDGVAYDPISQHVMDVICAARDEWQTRGTFTLQGDLDPDAGIAPLLVSWESHVSDLSRSAGQEGLKDVAEQEKARMQSTFMDLYPAVKDQKLQHLLQAAVNYGSMPGVLRANSSLPTAAASDAPTVSDTSERTPEQGYLV